MRVAYADNENALIFQLVENQMGFMRVHTCGWLDVEALSCDIWILFQKIKNAM